MGILQNGYKKVREVFSSASQKILYPIFAGGESAANNASNSVINFILGMTKWEVIPEEEIFEQMYCWEPEVGAGIDRIGTMVGECFQFFEAADQEELFLGEDVALPSDEILNKMVRHAKYLAEKDCVRETFSVYGEMLSMYGNLYIHENPDYSLEILPNKNVTLVDRKDRMTNPSVNMRDQVITRANYIIVNENIPDLRDEYDAADCYIVKIRDTPVWSTDILGRSTFGLYAVSPLQRLITTVWQMRIITVVDLMSRIANVPRDHHKLNAEMYSLDKYPGDFQEKVNSAKSMAAADCESHARKISGMMPDEHVVSLNTLEISPIEHSNVKYMGQNEIINQLSDKIWTSINVPKSIVTGISSSSYASELIMTNHAAIKIKDITAKVSEPILENMKKKLKALNSNYPVEYLRVKMDFSLANTDIDNVRQMSAMSVSHCYTYDECRAKTKTPALRKEQYGQLVSQNGTIGDDGNYEIPENTGLKYPDTSQSKNQRPTMAGMSSSEKAMSSKK